MEIDIVHDIRKLVIKFTRSCIGIHRWLDSLKTGVDIYKTPWYKLFTIKRMRETVDETENRIYELVDWYLAAIAQPLTGTTERRMFLS